MIIEEFIIDQNECVYRLEKYLKELNSNSSGDFGNKEKPWIKSRTAHKILIKFEYLY